MFHIQFHFGHYSLSEKRLIFADVRGNTEVPHDQPIPLEGRYETAWTTVTKHLDELDQSIKKLDDFTNHDEIQEDINALKNLSEKTRANLWKQLEVYANSVRKTAEQVRSEKFQLEKYLYDGPWKGLVTKIVQIEDAVLQEHEKLPEGYVRYVDGIRNKWHESLQKDQKLVAKLASDARGNLVYYMDMPDTLRVQGGGLIPHARGWGEKRIEFTVDQSLRSAVTVSFGGRNVSVKILGVGDSGHRVQTRGRYSIVPNEIHFVFAQPIAFVPEHIPLPREVREPLKAPPQKPQENIDRIRENFFSLVKAAQDLLHIGGNTHGPSLEGANAALKRLNPTDQAKLLKELQEKDWFGNTVRDSSGANIVWGLRVENGEVRAFSENVPEERRTEEAPREDPEQRAKEVLAKADQILKRFNEIMRGEIDEDDLSYFESHANVMTGAAQDLRGVRNGLEGRGIYQQIEETITKLVLGAKELQKEIDGRRQTEWVREQGEQVNELRQRLYADAMTLVEQIKYHVIAGTDHGPYLGELNALFGKYETRPSHEHEMAMNVGFEVAKAAGEFGAPKHDLMFGGDTLKFTVREIEDRTENPSESSEDKYNRIREYVLQYVERATQCFGTDHETFLQYANDEIGKFENSADRWKLIRELEGQDWFRDAGRDLIKPNVVWRLYIDQESKVRAYSESVPGTTEVRESLDEKITRAQALVTNLADKVRDFGGFENPQDPRLPQGPDKNPNPTVYVAQEELNDLLATFPADFTDWHKFRINRKIDGPYDWKYQIQKVPNEPRAEVVRLFAREPEIIKYDEQKLESALTNLWSLLEGGYRKDIEEELNNTILEQSELDPEKTKAWVNKQEWEGEDPEGVRYRLKREGILFTLEKIIDDSSPSDRPQSDSTETPPTPPGGTERPSEGTEKPMEYRATLEHLESLMTRMDIALSRGELEKARQFVDDGTSVAGEGSLNTYVRKILLPGSGNEAIDALNYFKSVTRDREFKDKEGNRYSLKEFENQFSLVTLDEGLDKEENELLDKIRDAFKRLPLDEAIKELWKILEKYFKDHGLLKPPPTLPLPPVGPAEGGVAPPAGPDAQPRFERREALRPNIDTEKIKQLEEEIKGLEEQLAKKLEEWKKFKQMDPLDFSVAQSKQMERLNHEITNLEQSIEKKKEELRKLREGLTGGELSPEQREKLAKLEEERARLVEAKKSARTENEKGRYQEQIDLVDAAIARIKGSATGRPTETTFKAEEILFIQTELQKLVKEQLLKKFQNLFKEKGKEVGLELLEMTITLQKEMADIALKFNKDFSDVAKLGPVILGTIIQELRVYVGLTVSIEVGSDKTSIVIKGLTKEQIVAIANKMGVEIRLEAAPKTMEWPANVTAETLKAFMDANYGAALKGAVEAKVSEGGHVTLSLKAKGEFKAGVARDFLGALAQKAVCTFEVSTDGTIKLEGPALALKALFSDVNKEAIIACLRKTPAEFTQWALNEGSEMVRKLRTENPQIFNAIVDLLLSVLPGGRFASAVGSLLGRGNNA